MPSIMAPAKLRTLSWWTFKTSIFCGVVGIMLLIAVPNPGFRDTADPLVRVIATSAFALAGIAILANLVALVSGTVAWIKGAGRCYWIIICVLLWIAPAVLFLASR